MRTTPETRYVRAPDGAYLAYQVVGDGPADVAVSLNVDESNVDLIWEDPDWLPFLEGPLRFARLILHDRRGLGASSRNVPPPNLETQVADLLTVLDAAGSETPVLAAGTEPGAMHALFAATHPTRVSGIAWNNPRARSAWAPDYPWGEGPAEFAESLESMRRWGTTEYAVEIAQWRAAEAQGLPPEQRGRTTVDPERVQRYARINRNTASPDVAAAINTIYWQTDVRQVLPSLHAPTALVTGEVDGVEEAAYIASLMPTATVHVVPGRSGVAVEPFMRILRDLCGASVEPVDHDSVLATVLFTDIVDSSSLQEAMGNRAWKDVLLAHHAVVRDCLARWRGVERDTAGDGFFATFDGPARAIQCAREITTRVQDLGITVRAGLHIGECEVVEGKVAGVAVSVGARVAALAGPSQVLVSQTVKDLVAGSGLTFADAGRHALKGVAGTWQLFEVTA